MLSKQQQMTAINLLSKTCLLAEKIEQDTGIPLSPRSPTSLTIGHNVASKQEVDAIMAEADRAGAEIVKRAQDTFWGGYAGYFQDPDGHLWEIVWNPDPDFQVPE